MLLTESHTPSQDLASTLQVQTGAVQQLQTHSKFLHGTMYHVLSLGTQSNINTLSAASKTGI